LINELEKRSKSFSRVDFISYGFLQRILIFLCISIQLR